MEKYIVQTFKTYPNQKIQDFIKLLYQATLGSGHLIHNIEDNYQYLLKEVDSLSYDPTHLLYEEISDELVRVHLEAIEKKYLKIYHALFMKSVEVTSDLSVFIERLIQMHDLPFDMNEWKQEVNTYISQGCPMVSHTQAFRDEYHPHYRLMKKDYIKVVELLKRIYDEHPKIISIDGMCGSGKSTLSELIHEIFGYSIIHMDDFFLQPHQRTSVRYQEIGGNIDYERFYEEVICSLKKNHDFTYQIFDCRYMKLNDMKKVSIDNGIVIEGCYAHHPIFKEYADLKVFLEIDEKIQQERILKRNGEKMLERFIKEWIPKENKYFECFEIKEKADMIL